jgi:hypothetical protein
MSSSNLTRLLAASALMLPLAAFGQNQPHQRAQAQQYDQMPQNHLQRDAALGAEHNIQRVEQDQIQQRFTARDVLGKQVVNHDGDRLGTVNDFALGQDLTNRFGASEQQFEGQAAGLQADDIRLYLSIGGVLGMGANYVEVPADSLVYDRDNDRFILDIPQDRLSAIVDGQDQDQQDLAQRDTQGAAATAQVGTTGQRDRQATAQVGTAQRDTYATAQQDQVGTADRRTTGTPVTTQPTQRHAAPDARVAGTAEVDTRTAADRRAAGQTDARVAGTADVRADRAQVRADADIDARAPRAQGTDEGFFGALISEGPADDLQRIADALNNNLDLSGRSNIVLSHTTGTIFLSGTVADEQLIENAEEIARQHTDREVRNFLQVARPLAAE